MILITGATGFIGRTLVRQFSSIGYPLRALIRPSPRSPRLPKGVPVEVAVVSLADKRGLRAALRDVDVIIHLASAENQGSRGSLLTADIQGTENLVEAASDAGVDRLVYLSHIGAGRSSAYPAFKAKGIAEEHIRNGKVPYTILRTSLVYGPEDHFTNNLSRLIRSSFGVFPIPSGGRTVVQPVWWKTLQPAFYGRSKMKTRSTRFTNSAAVNFLRCNKSSKTSWKPRIENVFWCRSRRSPCAP